MQWPAWALQIGAIIAVLVGTSFVSAGASAVSAITGALLLIVATTMRWRVESWSSAVRSGLLAGLIPFALLLSMKCGSVYFCALDGA